MTHVLAIDQGTTSSRAIVFDANLAIVAAAQEEYPQHFPRSGWVEHDPDDIWSSVAATCRGAIERAGILRRRPRGDRHHQPARDDARLGARHRPPARPRHRLAGPPHRRPSAPSSARPGTSPWSPRAPASSSTPTSPAPSSSLAPRRPRRVARAGAPRRAPLRHRRQLLDLAPDRRRAPRHRRHQRRPDPALRHPHGRLGPRHLRPPRHPPRDAARGPRLRRRLRRHPPRPLRRPPRPDPRRRRRPAGGDRRPGLLRAGHAEVDLRHRLLRRAQHRHDPGREPEPPAHHHRLPARRQADLRPRRLDLRRRRRRSSGFATASGSSATPPRPAPSPRRPTRPSASTSSPPSPASAPPTGTPTAAARSSA